MRCCRRYHAWMVRLLRPPLLETTLVPHKENHGHRMHHVLTLAQRRSEVPVHIRQASVLLRRITRTFVSAQFANYLTPPAVFVGLLLTLWVYKCLMMIIFQNKIIYMPSVPPFSRRETVESYATQYAPISWKEERIKSLDGTRISLCVGNNNSVSNILPSPVPIYIIYFQGNASSLPPRLPLLSTVLKRLKASGTPCTLVALSYRGFWSSSGSPSQYGIEKDASAAIKWVTALRDREFARGQVLLWGQSIGAGVALNAAVKHAVSVDGIILETPFLSIKQMLISMYPQRWLPYRYLWPFLRNHWDSGLSLRMLQKKKVPPMLMLTAEKDEVVPADHGKALLRLATDLNFPVDHVCIQGALHHEVLIKSGGLRAITDFVRQFSVQDKEGNQAI